MMWQPLIFTSGNLRQQTKARPETEIFFRKNPFKGEFTIFAGLGDCVKLLENFHYSESDITYLRTIMPASVEEEFYEFLQQLSPKDVSIYSVAEGSVVFPRVPLLRITGPLIVVQLLETTFLTLVNFASLMTTNASRYRIAAGKDIKLLEFGLRRAQGPDGGLTASKYAYIGEGNVGTFHVALINSDMKTNIGQIGRESEEMM